MTTSNPERQLLALIFIDQRWARVAMRRGLTPTHFKDPVHREVWRVIARRAKRRSSTGFQEIWESLRDVTHINLAQMKAIERDVPQLDDASELIQEILDG